MAKFRLKCSGRNFGSSLTGYWFTRVDKWRVSSVSTSHSFTLNTSKQHRDTMTTPSMLARTRPLALTANTSRRPLVSRLAGTSRRTLIPQPAPPLVTPRPLPTTLRANTPEAQANRASMEALRTSLDEMRAKAREGGGKATLEKWKARGKGKLSARERCVPYLCLCSAQSGNSAREMSAAG